MSTVTLPRATVEQALEALESLFNWKVDPERGKRCGDAVVALRAALAEDALDRLAENERALGIQMEAPRATLAQQQTKRACCTYPDCRCPIDKSTVCAKGLPEQAEPVEPNRWEGDHDIESPNNACMHKGYCMSLKQAREPLAQQAEPVEPVAYRHLHEDGWEYHDAPIGEDCAECQALYTAPPQQAEPVEPVEPVATPRINS